MDHPDSPTNGFVTSRDWTLERLLEFGPRFRTVDRISINSGTPDQIASRIKDYEQRCVPLVAHDFHLHSDWPNYFTPQWLKTHHGSQMVEVRNVHGERLDRESSITELIDTLRDTPRFAQPEERERLYGKDMHCPEEWRDWIKTSGVLPDVVVPGATGDVLPETVETLMGYLGVSDTFTPLHKDPCASYGQNIMCCTEDGGSSFWFMTSPSDCGDVTDYFRGLGHELDWEDHVATVKELADAPFDVYVLEQKLGDLVLVPPRSFHQVVNAGGITIKVSWSRMSMRSLEIALYHELPAYRRVCRPEIYRVKRTIYDTLVQRTTALETLLNDTPDSTFDSVNPLCKDVARLIDLLDDVLEQEYSTQHRRLRQVTNYFVPGGHGPACDFCGADIFLSSFQCDSCSLADGSRDPICLCPTCVVEGRMCKCRSMEPVQGGSFRDLLRSRNNAMYKLRDAREAEFYEEEPDVLSDQHLIESVKTTFHAAWLLIQKRRDILNSQKTTRMCTLARKNSHVVDGWAIIICKECHSGKCFTHILEAGIHSSEALMTVELDNTYGRWHSIHANRRESHEGPIPRLKWTTKTGAKTPIDRRLVHFAQNFQTPRPLSKQVTFGFYDKKLPDPEEVDQLDPVPVTDPEATKSGTREETPVQRHLHRLESGSPAVAGLAETAPRKRKRPSEPPNLNVGPDLPSQPSQPTMDGRASAESSQISKPPKRLIMDYVLITTLPPKLRRKPVPPETSGGEDRSQVMVTTRGREKQRGKRREVASTSRAPVPPDPRSLADESMHSRSHSVSSIRPPLFEPETSLPPDSDPIEAEESLAGVRADEADDSDDLMPLPFVSHRQKRVESKSPTSPAVLPSSSSPSPSPQPDKRPYHTIIDTKQRLPGPQVRFAPHQRQLARTPASMYPRQVFRPVAGPSHSPTRVGPPKRTLPNRSDPRLRLTTELHPPRPPQPPPELTALEARMEARINALGDENQKLRDDLLTVRSDLAVAKNDLSTALTRVGAMEHNLYGLETLDPKFEEMKENYERLSTLLRGEHLFDSEKFRTAIRTEVKSNIGYYWPSLESDLRAQLWKEFPEPVKEYVEKEIGQVVDEVVMIRSDLVALQQNPAVGGNVQNGDLAIPELRQAMERIAKKQEELEEAILEIGRVRESERAQGASTSSVPRLIPNNTGNMLPPNLPQKPSSTWQDKFQQSPHRRGAQTPPTASDQNSYPVHQGPDEEVNDSLRTGPTQDPRRKAAPSRSLSTLPPIPTRSFHSSPIFSQPTTFRSASEELSPSTSAPPTPTLPQPFHGMHPSRLAQLETDVYSPTITNNLPPASTTPIPRPQPILSVTMPRSESTPSILTKPPAGMHPERFTSLIADNRSPSTVTWTQSPPHTSLNNSQQHLPPVERSIDPLRSLPSFLSGTNVTVGPIPSSSRVRLDDLVTSPAPAFPSVISSPPPFSSDSQRTPSHPHKDPNRSPSPSKKGKAAQKRKASEALPSPKPSDPRKRGKVEKWKLGHEPARVQGMASKKKRPRKRKDKANRQPGPSNPRRDGPGHDPGRSSGLSHK